MAIKDKEIWKQLSSLKGSTTKNYAVSTHGKLGSFEKNINELTLLKSHLNSGFPMIKVRVNKKAKALFVHNAIGEAFLKKHSPKCKSIIHLDYNKENNHISNLKWATKTEKIEHSKKSPLVIQAISRKVQTGSMAKKLDEKKVIQLKKEMWNPKRKVTFKQLATKYDIAEMNLYRIKNGELWFHVHVEGEPIFPKYKEQLKNIEFHQKLEAKQKIATEKRKAIILSKIKAATEKRKKQESKKKVASTGSATKAKTLKKLTATGSATKAKTLKKVTATGLTAKAEKQKKVISTSSVNKSKKSVSKKEKKKVDKILKGKKGKKKNKK